MNSELSEAQVHCNSNEWLCIFH